MPQRPRVTPRSVKTRPRRNITSKNEVKSRSLPHARKNESTKIARSAKSFPHSQNIYESLGKRNIPSSHIIVTSTLNQRFLSHLRSNRFQKPWDVRSFWKYHLYKLFYHSYHSLREKKQNLLQSFQIPLGQAARMEQLTMRDLDNALKEFKVEKPDMKDTDTPEFKLS